MIVHIDYPHCSRENGVAYLRNSLLDGAEADLVSEKGKYGITGEALIQKFNVKCRSLALYC